MHWEAPQRPAELVENRLINAIVDGEFPINSTLPPERELAQRLGVTRPTLREALQRLARDGWLDIQQGKPTRVRDYWREGNLGILARLAQSPANQPMNFIDQLLEVRLLLAPEYTRQAVEQSPEDIVAFLQQSGKLNESPVEFARFDWGLHRSMTQLAVNPIYRLLLNSFHSLYITLGEHYFTYDECRRHSRTYYAALLDCARQQSAAEAEVLTRQTMSESRLLWRRLQI